MKKLIAKLNVVDGFGNQKTLKIFTDREEGTVSYSLTSDGGCSFSISNMQCGWRGPLLPDNTYEYKTNRKLLNSVIEAVKGGVYKVINETLFIK